MCPPGQCHRRTFAALKPSVHPPRSPRPCPSPKPDHRGASFPFRGVKSRGSAASTLSPSASLPQRHAHRLPVSSQPQSRLLRWRDAVRRLDAGVFARPGRTARVQDFDPRPSAPSAPCPRAARSRPAPWTPRVGSGGPLGDDGRGRPWPVSRLEAPGLRLLRQVVGAAPRAHSPARPALAGRQPCPAPPAERPGPARPLGSGPSLDGGWRFPPFSGVTAPSFPAGEGNLWPQNPRDTEHVVPEEAPRPSPSPRAAGGVRLAAVTGPDAAPSASGGLVPPPGEGRGLQGGPRDQGAPRLPRAARGAVRACSRASGRGPAPRGRHQQLCRARGAVRGGRLC